MIVVDDDVELSCGDMFIGNYLLICLILILPSPSCHQFVALDLDGLIKNIELVKLTRWGFIEMRVLPMNSQSFAGELVGDHSHMIQTSGLCCGVN